MEKHASFGEGAGVHRQISKSVRFTESDGISTARQLR